MLEKIKSDFCITGEGLPKAPYGVIAATILGKNYDLSVVSVKPKMARNLNKKYRKKNYTPDVLAFPLTKTSGEIVLSAHSIEGEAKRSGLSPSEYAAYIFIHACLHLRGLVHGSYMNAREMYFSRKLGIKMPYRTQKSNRIYPLRP